MGDRDENFEDPFQSDQDIIRVHPLHYITEYTVNAQYSTVHYTVYGT